MSREFKQLLKNLMPGFALISPVLSLYAALVIIAWHQDAAKERNQLLNSTVHASQVQPTK